MKPDKKKQLPLQNPKNTTKISKKQVAQKLPDDMREILLIFMIFKNQVIQIVIIQDQFLVILLLLIKPQRIQKMKFMIFTMHRKDSFSLKELMHLISRRWFENKGRDEDIDEIYELFVKKDHKIGLNEIKNVFSQYLDLTISDSDILEFISDASKGEDTLTKEDLATKMNYF
ncbi:unnamed protein product [Paramecium sonneborni]|uniref:Uncharacterized protein n=1 Tax=Paramecium sonneborni TaxID=65129 RepID=A0A8S1LUL9_9CILI|nr:unnamed protein product [Paramecium sonneborni]